VEDRMDRLVNLDFSGRGIEHLHRAARERAGKPLVLAAAELLAAVPRGSVVVLATGSASRSWITTSVSENDGPAGAAVLARALVLGLDAVPVLVSEAALLGAVGGVVTAAGMCVVALEEARRAGMPGGRLSTAVLRAYPTGEEEGRAAAVAILDELRPAAVVAVERPGRNDRGVYHNARGVDFGAGRARIDELFEEAARRGLPSVAVGDGGNEIGMGAVAEAVRDHVPYGDRCRCGCGGGIGAVTSADVLVTATCSNWGCYAVVACLAVLLGDLDLLHTSGQEELLLRRGVELGLINSPGGRVDPNVDGIPLECHKAVVELLRELAVRRANR